MVLTLATMLIAEAPESNLPLSRQATLVESYSPTELTIKTTGLGKRDKDALLDARKAAVYFTLFLGTDALLSSPEAKQKFEMIGESFFDSENINQFISWEADQVVSTVSTRLPDGKKGFKLTKVVRVNTGKLREVLTSQGIITSSQQLSAALGMPFIMVIPETPIGQTPLEVFDSNPLAKHAAATIESYLTQRKYDVTVPRAAEVLKDMTRMQQEIGDAQEDVAYQLALALGSDVYITFAGILENNKAAVTVKAYETTTARLLGSETGYSATRPGSRGEALTEEAINDAIDKVLSRVNGYWQDDLVKGMQYRIVFSMNERYSKQQSEEIQDALLQVVEENFALSKENVVTPKTVDLLVWATGEEYRSASALFRMFKSRMASVAEVGRITINRKLLLLEIR
jgi:5-hydroxyisourate hydrolase-like protein (transthyretin family)